MKNMFPPVSKNLKGALRKRPPPIGQKFAPGIFVMVADDLGTMMGHFEKACAARVQYTYAHAYGGEDSKSYSLLIRGERKWYSVAWYYEDQLTEITDKDLITQYTAEIAKQHNSSA